MGLHSAQSGARRNLGGDSCSWEMKHSEPSRFMSVNQTSEVIASKKPPCNLQLEILSVPLLLNSIPASSKGDDFVSVCINSFAAGPGGFGPKAVKAPNMPKMKLWSHLLCGCELAQQVAGLLDLLWAAPLMKEWGK